jgi:hypothetical protein
MFKPIAVFTFAVALWASMSPVARAQAHYTPGLASIRDYSVPEPGLYVAIYNYDYQTSNLTDNNGNKTTQVVLGPPNGPNLPVNLKVDANIYALAPLILWITPGSSWAPNMGIPRSDLLQQQDRRSTEWAGNQSQYVSVRSRRSVRSATMAGLESQACRCGTGVWVLCSRWQV